MHSKKGTVIDTKQLSIKKREQIRDIAYLTEKNKDLKIVYFHEKNFGLMYTPDKRYLIFGKKNNGKLHIYRSRNA